MAKSIGYCATITSLPHDAPPDGWRREQPEPYRYCDHSISRPWPGSGEIDWIHRRRREGAGHTRYMEPEWARDLRDQCSDTGTAVFLKHM